MTNYHNDAFGRFVNCLNKINDKRLELYESKSSFFDTRVGCPHLDMKFKGILLSQGFNVHNDVNDVKDTGYKDYKEFVDVNNKPKQTFVSWEEDGYLYASNKRFPLENKN